MSGLWGGTPCSWDRSEENDQTGSIWQEGNGVSNNHTLETWWAEKGLRMHKVPNLKVDELKQQKATLGSTPDSQEQESENTVDTGSPKLDRLDKPEKKDQVMIYPIFNWGPHSDAWCER